MNYCSKHFIDSIQKYIAYWECQEHISTKEKLEGISFSILCMLDGVTTAFDGDINELCENDCMLHEMFYKEETL